MKRFFSLISVVIALHITCAFIHAVALANKSRPLPQQQSVAQRVKQLHELLSEQWEYTLRTSPEFASILGDKRYNDQVSDNSLAGIRRDTEESKKFQRRFEAIDTAGFSAQEKINKALMVHNLRDNIESVGFKEYEMPV